MPISKQQQNLITNLLETVTKLNNEFVSDKVNNMKNSVLGYKITKRGNKLCTRIRINGKQTFISGNTISELETNLKISLKQQAEVKQTKTYKLFGVWWEEYLNLYKIGQLKPSTLNSYKSVYKIHLSEFANIYLNQIDIFMVNKFLQCIEGARQRQQVYDMLKACLQKAVDLELIKKNPCALLPRPKHVKEHINALTEQDQAKFLEAMKGDKCADYYLFLLLTGCRRGEALAVTRADVDFDKMTIKINKTLSGGKIGSTKTIASVRNIPIFNQLYSEVLYKFVNFAPEQRLFELSEKQIEKHFYNICRKAGLEGISLHSFRHTFASRCFAIDIPALQIQKWLGHKDVLTTQQIYIHLMDSTQQKYLNIANNYDFIATQSATQVAQKA